MMTNEEAIKWIEYVANESSMAFDDDSDETRLIKEKVYANIKQALFMAIKALSQTKQIGCTGCEYYDQQQTRLICHDCKRYYSDKYTDGEDE